jgi:hypothetical protein
MRSATAAIAAGYSAKTADTQGARLLVNVKVAEVIKLPRSVLRKAKIWAAFSGRNSYRKLKVWVLRLPAAASWDRAPSSPARRAAILSVSPEEIRHTPSSGAALGRMDLAFHSFLSERSQRDRSAGRQALKAWEPLQLSCLCRPAHAPLCVSL